MFRRYLCAGAMAVAAAVPVSAGLAAPVAADPPPAVEHERPAEAPPVDLSRAPAPLLAHELGAALFPGHRNGLDHHRDGRSTGT